MDRLPPRQTRSPLGGGMPLAIGMMVGAFLGMMAGQPTIGFLGGLGVGLAAAVTIWLIDRRR